MRYVLIGFLTLAAAPVFGNDSAASLLAQISGKWKGQGTLNRAPGCVVTFDLSPLSSESAAAQYQIQCPGYQNQNQFNFDAQTASAVTTSGFTDVKSTDWFGVIETDTLQIQIEDPAPTTETGASQLSFDLKVEKSGQATVVHADLLRDRE